MATQIAKSNTTLTSSGKFVKHSCTSWFHTNKGHTNRSLIKNETKTKKKKKMADLHIQMINKNYKGMTTIWSYFLCLKWFWDGLLFSFIFIFYYKDHIYNVYWL